MVKYGALLDTPDIEALEIAVATILANRAEGDAVATFIVAPPSTGKTETVIALAGAEDTFVLPNVRKKTLVSGLDPGRGEETALLLTMPNPGTAIIKDFSAVLSLARSERDEVVDQLRQIMDGRFSQAYGTGRKVEWQGRIGFLGAATKDIDNHHGVIAKLGDRFLYVRLRTNPDRLATATSALRSTGKESAARNELSRSVADFLASLGTPALDDIECSEYLEWRITIAADVLTRGRTPVSRDKDKSITELPEPEGISRVTKALHKLCKCLAWSRGRFEVDNEDISSIDRIALDTIPETRARVLHAVGPNGASLTEIMDQGLPGSTATYALQELALLGLLSIEGHGRSTRTGDGVIYTWKDSASLYFTLSNTIVN